MVQRQKKRSILFINQYYAPDLASTGQLLTELCESLSEDFDISVLTGTPSYSIGAGKKYGGPSQVKVIRVFNTRFSRAGIVARLINYISFMLCALLRSFFLNRRDITVVMSDPPTVNFIGFIYKKLKGGRLVQICQDIYPELAIKLKKANNPLALKIFSWMNRNAQSSCDRIVAIGNDMKSVLKEKALPADKIEVIENWIDTDLVRPQSKSNPFSEKHGLADKFVVMHSGNIGLSQNLQLLLDAAVLLKERNDILFVLIGDGAAKDDLETYASQKVLSSVRFMDYQDRSQLKYSLSSGDLHYISLKEGLSGLIVPSKVYGIMAAGRPAICVLEKDSDIYKLAKDAGFASTVKADPESIAKEILYFYNNPAILKDLGQKGRDAVVKRNSRKVITEKYGRLFAGL